jgi:hypothetical protein
MKRSRDEDARTYVYRLIAEKGWWPTQEVPQGVYVVDNVSSPSQVRLAFLLETSVGMSKQWVIVSGHHTPGFSHYIRVDTIEGHPSGMRRLSDLEIVVAAAGGHLD